MGRPRPRHGSFLGIPYDWRRLTRERIRFRLWNPDEPLLIPRVFGWGWTINFARLFGRGRKRC